MRVTIPTYISFLRLALLIPILLLLITDSPIIALAFTLIALVSDWLDGFLARKYNWISDLGSFVDHFADKMLVHVILLYFVAVHDLSAVAFGLLLVRDFLVLGVRHVVAQQGKELSSMSLGKIKFVGQSVLLVLLMLSLVFPGWLWVAANVMLWFSVVLSLVSAAQLLIASGKVL